VWSFFRGLDANKMKKRDGVLSYWLCVLGVTKWGVGGVQHLAGAIHFGLLNSLF